MKKRLVLIIYILLHCVVFGQQLRLDYTTSSGTKITAIDSTLSQIKFNNTKSLIKFNDSIITQMQRSGYFGLRKQPLQKTNDSTYLQKLDLGHFTPYIKIIHVGRNHESIMDTLSRKRDDIIIESKKLYTHLEQQKDLLNNQGYPFAKVKIHKWEALKKDTALIYITKDTGRIRSITDIKIKGYPQFPTKFLRPILRKQHKATTRNIDIIKNQINSLPFTSIAKEPELQFKKDSTNLYLYVKKEVNNTIDGLIGFDNSGDGQIELNGYLELRLNNNLNAGEQLHVEYRGENEEQTKFYSQLKIPYVFRTNLGIETSLLLLRRDSTYLNNEFHLGTYYLINNQTTTGITYQSINSNTNDTSNQSSGFKKNAIAAYIQTNKQTDNPLFLNQYYYRVGFSVGSRATDDNSNQQQYYSVLAQHRIPITKHININTKGQLTYLQTENLLFNELFQIGGANNIRGFNQNSIDTSFFTGVFTDIEYQLSPGFYMHSIADVGLYENFASNQIDTIYSIGLGAGILTKSGLLKISIANGVFKGANIYLTSTIANINMLIRF